MSVRFDGKEGIGRFLVEVAALFSLWIATHPYRGVIHDGRLYTIQALNTLDPGRFAQDLYFKFGSQDSLTNFSLIYGPLVAAFGPVWGHFCASVLGAAVFGLALTFLMGALLDDRREALAAILACIVLDAGYGGLNIFHYGEGFATPRIFAEALVMAALALCLRGRLIGSVLCLAAAAATHPIMAVTGMAVAGAWVAFEDRRALLAIGLAAMVGVVLAAAGVQPFARLFISFDPDWFIIVLKRCGFGFLSRWNPADALHLSAVAATLWVAYALGKAGERRLIVCVAVTSAGGLLATLLGCDLFRNVLLVNIQPWRGLWLAALIANAGIALIVLRLPKSQFSRELFLWAAALSMLVTLRLQITAIAALSQLLAALAFEMERRLETPLPKPIQLLFLIAPITGAVVTGFVLYAEAATQELWRAVALAGLAGAALAVLALSEARKPAPVLVLCGVVATALTGAALFDQRTGWQKFVEAAAPDPELQAFVAGSRNIYWEDGVELFWFKLKRPSYYSCLQSAGAMFYRGTAMEYERRSRRLSVLNTHDFAEEEEDICFTKPLPDQTGTTSSGQLQRACQALPELDAIVLPYPIGGVRAQNWNAPAERKYRESSNIVSHFKTYYKYLCEDFR